MAKHHGDISHISGAIVKRLATSRGSKDRNPRPTRQKEVPFVAVGMPMQLAHGTGLERYECCGDVGCGREGGRVDDLESSSVGDGEGLLL